MSLVDDGGVGDPQPRTQLWANILRGMAQRPITPYQLALAAALRARGAGAGGPDGPATNSYGLDTQSGPLVSTNAAMQGTNASSQNLAGAGGGANPGAGGEDDQPPGALDSVTLDALGREDRGSHLWTLPEFTRLVDQGPAFNRPFRASGGPATSHNRVTYDYPDGGMEVRTGGTLAWRDHNPGNLRAAPDDIGSNQAYSQKAPNHAAPFAIFPDDEAGDYAQERQLFEPGFSRHDYPDLSIADAVKQYAPKTENDTAAMITRLSSAAGVPQTTIMGTLTPSQRTAFMAKERAYEQYTPGASVYWNAPDSWPVLKY
jgi:hypothetical protein